MLPSCSDDPAPTTATAVQVRPTRLPGTLPLLITDLLPAGPVTEPAADTLKVSPARAGEVAPMRLATTPVAAATSSAATSRLMAWSRVPSGWCADSACRTLRSRGVVEGPRAVRSSRTRRARKSDFRSCPCVDPGPHVYTTHTGRQHGTTAQREVSSTAAGLRSVAKRPRQKRGRRTGPPGRRVRRACRVRREHRRR